MTDTTLNTLKKAHDKAVAAHHELQKSLESLTTGRCDAIRLQETIKRAGGAAMGLVD